MLYAAIFSSMYIAVYECVILLYILLNISEIFFWLFIYYFNYFYHNFHKSSNITLYMHVRMFKVRCFPITYIFFALSVKMVDILNSLTILLLHSS